MFGAILGTLALLGIISATDNARKPKPPAPSDTCYVMTVVMKTWDSRNRRWISVSSEPDTVCTSKK